MRGFYFLGLSHNGAKHAATQADELSAFRPAKRESCFRPMVYTQRLSYSPVLGEGEDDLQW
jgi:hypothetical protein